MLRDLSLSVERERERETIYRRSREDSRRERESAIPRRDTRRPKSKTRRYRTVDADYWPMIPISRWHLRAVITIFAYIPILTHSTSSFFLSFSFSQCIICIKDISTDARISSTSELSFSNLEPRDTIRLISVFYINAIKVLMRM